jgi:hypothetical protein
MIDISKRGVRTVQRQICLQDPLFNDFKTCLISDNNHKQSITKVKIFGADCEQYIFTINNT